MSESVVIIGAGQGAAQTVTSLRQEGFAGAITVIGDEPYLPYQRPPLSKAYLAGELAAERLFIRPQEFYDEAIEKRQLAIAILKQALEMGRQSMNLAEPFWPPNPRFDAIAPGQDVGTWFVVAACEQLERASAYSSFFFNEEWNLDWLSRQPFVSTEIEVSRGRHGIG